MPSPDPADRHELMERYKLAHAEYRAEVTLGWDRAKFFVLLPASITAAVSSLAHHRLAAQGALVCAALVALSGVLIVLRSHGRYRATRTAVQALENALGIEDVQTTGGQRKARGILSLERFRVLDVLIAVYVLLAGLDVALAVLW